MPLFKKSNPEQTSQNKKSTKKQEERQFLTAQDSIFYQSMMQDGMCILGDDMYSRTYRFDDVNYRLNRRDDQEQTFIKFCEMYNYLDPETFFQILLVNRTGDSNNFMDQMFYPLHGDGYDAYRKEVNSVISKRRLEGNNNIVRDRFITFGLHSSDPQAVRQKLSRLETDTAQQFKAMGSNLHLLSGEQRLEVISSLLKPDEPFDFTYDELPISGRSTKDFVCPPSFDFKPVRMFHFGDKIGQILYASKFPDTLSDEVLCDISDLPIHDASGKPVTEEVEHIIPYYRPVYVYDVSQTDGEPLPKLTTELSGTVNQYSQLLTALRAVSPYPITFNQLPGYSPSCHGYCSYAEQQIVVRENMPQEQTIKTIIHEIAHAVVHAPQSDLPPDQKPDRQSCEVQAESIAFIVCNYLNIDSSEYTFPYIASWSSDYELKELQDSLQTIQTAANELIGQISSEIDKLQVQQKEPEHAKPLSLNERIAAAKDAAKKYNLERSLTTPEKENFNELECTASNI